MALFESSLVTVMGDVEPDSMSNCETGAVVPPGPVSVPFVTASSDEKTDDCPVLLELLFICDCCCCCCCCAAARMPDSEFCCGFVPTVGGGPFLLDEPPSAL